MRCGPLQGRVVAGRWHRWAAVLVLSLLAYRPSRRFVASSAAAAAAASSTDDKKKKGGGGPSSFPFAYSSPSNKEYLECGIWLALSSLPNTGMGMYAGKAYKRGQPFQSPLGDISVPISDMKSHNEDPGFHYLWDSYTWGTDPGNLDFTMDQEAPSLDFASPGFGSLANSFLPLLNADHSNPKWIDAGLHRSKDPGAGARTLYGDRVFTARRDIRAGEELFVSYGEDWFKWRYEYLGAVPLTDDLKRATELFRAHRRVMKKHPARSKVVQRAWDDFVATQKLYPESRVLGSFNFSDPDEPRQLRTGKTLTQLRTEQSFRDEDWLNENGVCGDHIEVGASTLEQAGLGAFASRDLPRGTVVTTMPMVHIPDRKVYDMYRLELGEDGEHKRKVEEGVVSYQLVINYCLGHRDSTLLLCPYGPQAPYINHNQTRANVKLVWGDPKRGNHHPHFLEGPVDALQQAYSAKLAMDVVATRDIEQGEELLMDYGPEWEAAWKAHVERWQPTEGSEFYADAHALNKNHSRQLHTAFELLGRPLPGVGLRCNSAYESKRWKRYYPDKMDNFHDTGTIYECDVLRVQKDGRGNSLYTAVMWNSDPSGGEPQFKGTLSKVPRQAFHYYNHHWATDQYLPNAFRHDIRIPDDLFPEAWKNRRS